jgi:hypothetical protein
MFSSWLVDEEKEAHDELESYGDVCVYMLICVCVCVPYANVCVCINVCVCVCVCKTFGHKADIYAHAYVPTHSDHE